MIRCLARCDFATDLAEDIGCARWYRGLGLVLALIVAAVLLGPGLAPVAAAPAISLDSASRDDLHATAIGPLALGADSGWDRGGWHRAPAASVVPIASVPEPPRLDLVATLNAGDSFARLLARAGVGAGDAARVLDLVASAVPPGQIVPGTRIAMTLGPRPGDAPRPLEHLDLRARFDLTLAVDRRGTGLDLSRHVLAVDATPLRIRGAVGQSLALSAYAAGAPAKAVQQYLQALDAHIGFDAVAPGDTYDLIVGYKRAADGESEVGSLLYAGLEHDGRPRLQLVREGSDDGSGALVDIDTGDEGGAPAPHIFAPVTNARLTSTYGMRFHPILGYTRMHEGIDLAAPWGAPIHAMAAGIVSYAGLHGGHGNYVRLEHGGGFGTGYAHMSRIAVMPGERVGAGQVIGYVGATGLATGPHLHFEVYRDGRTVNPLSVPMAMIGDGNGGFDHADHADLAALRAKLTRLLLVRPGMALAPLKGFR